MKFGAPVLSFSGLSVKKIISSPSALALLASNLFMIFLAVSENWPIGLVLWVYWSQSVIIGFFQFLKILSLKDFSTEDFKVNGKPVHSKHAKHFAAIFFAFHYGFFHLVYLTFIGAFFLMGRAVEVSASAAVSAVQASPNPFFVMLAVAVFFANHLLSFVFFLLNGENTAKRLGAVFALPYYRIVPMHLTIILGSFFMYAGGGQLVLVFFLLLKTLVDLAQHEAEHAAG